MDDINAALHSLPRMRIMAYLFSVQQSDFARLAEMLEMSSSELSKHVRVLRELELIRSSVRRGRGAPVTVHLTKLGESEFRRYRSTMSKILFSDDSDESRD